MARRPHPDAVISGAWLLRYARTRTPDLPQTALAEALGSTSGSLSRYEGGTRELTFAELQRAIGHTDYRAELRLVHEPRNEPIYELIDSNEALYPYHVQHGELERRMPAALVGYEHTLPGESPRGPAAGEALYWLYRLQALRARARTPERRLQAAYSEHKNERDRDLIHHLLDCGSGAHQAVHVLKAEIQRAVPIRRPGRLRRSPQSAEQRIGLLAWAHAVCTVRAETAICATAADRLAGADTARAEHERAILLLADAQRTADWFKENGRGAKDGLAELELAREREAKAARRRAALTANGRAKDVGTAGERYLALELRQVADTAAELFTEMAAQEEWRQWRNAAELDPLYAAWLDGDLAAQAAPPQYLPDDEAVDRYWRTLTGHRADSAPDGAALDRVADPQGREWTVTAAQFPSPGNQAAGPRTAVLAACPGSGTYVLAEGLPIEKARMRVHAILGRGANLVDLAAALMS